MRSAGSSRRGECSSKGAHPPDAAGDDSARPCPVSDGVDHRARWCTVYSSALYVARTKEREALIGAGGRKVYSKLMQ